MVGWKERRIAGSERQGVVIVPVVDSEGWGLDCASLRKKEQWGRTTTSTESA